MAREEINAFIVRGEITPEKYLVVSEMLGGLGLSAEIIDEPQPVVTEEKEWDYYPALLSSKRDFLNFAAAIGESQNIAGRSWRRLEELYLFKNFPDFKCSEFKYGEMQTELVPDLFVGVRRQKRGDVPVAGIGLKLEALESYVETLRSVSSVNSVDIADYLGEGASIHVFDFWVDFIPWKRQAAHDALQAPIGDTAAQQK